MGEIKIGVVGYCPPTKFDQTEARRMIIDAYDRVASYFAGHRIAIVSGLTNVGVLAIAYKEARKRGWRTVGIACKRAFEHPVFPVDEQKIVGEEWGEESRAFLDELDAIIRIGFGKQSLREAEAIKAKGLPVFEYDLPSLD
jgi:predicted Rossmann-fold nucleotide-binding protein